MKDFKVSSGSSYKSSNFICSMLTILIIGISSLLNGQDFTEQLDQLFFTCNLKSDCDCFEDIKIEGRNSIQYKAIYDLTTYVRETKDTIIFSKLKQWYNKLDKSYTDCWLGFYTIPPTYSNSVAMEWAQIYYDIEVLLKYLELVNNHDSSLQKFTRIDSMIVNIIDPNPISTKQYVEGFYNQSVFNNSDTWLYILSVTPYKYYLIDHIDTYKKYIIDKIKMHTPRKIKDKKEQVFLLWLEILLDSGRKELLVNLLEEKRKHTSEKDIRDKYEGYFERINSSNY